MSNILLRTLTGAVFISVILFPLFWNDIVASCVFGVFMILGLIEFYKLFKNSETVELSWELGLIAGLFLFGISTGVLFNYLPTGILFSFLPIVFSILTIELWRKKKNPLLNGAVISFGLFYVVIPFILMVYIVDFDNSEFPLLAGMFLLIWMNDTFAYLSGRFFGKTKLIERISPNKTWEGMIGGILFTILAGVVIGLLFDDNKTLFWIISACIIAPISVAGDLLESSFKRSMNVKDSGNILPGHGGVLDRFDATLLTVPFFLAWIFIYNYI